MHKVVVVVVVKELSMKPVFLVREKAVGNVMTA
jgi:hypothetical protein